MNLPAWVWWIPGLFCLFAWGGLTLLFRRGFRSDLFLESLADGDPAALPPVAIIVPALNEAAAVEDAMRSLLALRYHDLRIIAVDDRSSDSTGAILDRLAAEDPRLTVIHVETLPPGWLGKNHALHVGAAAVDSPWILFTDADVQFHPDALRRAVKYAEDRGLAHLALLPRVILHGFWETLFVSFFGVIFSARFRPWAVADPRSGAYVGVGAFNLVRARAYREMGGHAALPLEVADDVKLGKLLKARGGRAAVLASREMVKVRWISGLRGGIEGLTKNMFAGVGFSPFKLIGACLLLFALAVWPVIGTFAGPVESRLGCLAAWLAMAAAAGAPGLTMGVSPLIGLGYPVAGLLIIYTMLRSMWMTYRLGGVVWRGTLYPLEELKRGVV